MHTILDFCLDPAVERRPGRQVSLKKYVVFSRRQISSTGVVLAHREISRQGGHMHNCSFLLTTTLGIALAMVMSTPRFAGAQSSGAARKTDTKSAQKSASAPNAKAWTLPRTPDGQPDLQGYWTSLSFTPMERPAKFGGREFLTEEEAAQIYKEGVQHSYDVTYDDLAETPVYDSTVYALSAWQHGVAPNRRSSLVVDPPDGKIPPLTPEATQAREAA